MNDNLLRSKFNHQTPVMDPLKGLQSSFPGKKLNDNQFRTQNSLQASDVNTTNGFINNYIAPNVVDIMETGKELKILLGLLV